MPRRDVIASSPNKDDYERLIEAGWSSLSLERYAALRFGERIDGSLFRRYRQKMNTTIEKADPEDEKLARLRRDELIDIVQERADMIRLQKQRVMTDVGLEIGSSGMGKLFQTTRFEIELLSDMLSAHAEDLQTLGVMPKANQQVEVTHRTGSPEPEKRTLQEIMGSDADSETLATVVHLALAKPTGTDHPTPP